MEHFSHDNKTIAIFGGASNWGEKISNICRHLHMNVRMIDPKLETSADETRNAVQNADIVFFASPADKIRGNIESVRDLLHGKIILDCATSKSGFEDIFLEIADKNSICSTHPMVNETTPASGQNILLMPIGEHGESAKQVAKQLFETVRMEIISDISFTEHRRMMAVMQFLPHLMQRAMIATAGIAMQSLNTNIEKVSARGPANFHLTELAMGRVGMQPPGTSNTIIVDALGTDFGKQILSLLRDSLQQIEAAASNSKDLTALLEKDVERLDPKEHPDDKAGPWRKKMRAQTDAMVERRGNLRARSCTIESPADVPGTLLTICEIFKRHNINMTAMDSHVSQDLGPRSVRFDIGISDESINWYTLQDECQKKGLTLHRLDKRS